MENVKTWAYRMFHGPAFGKRFAVMMTGIFMMGFNLSFLIDCGLGYDPYSFMMLQISARTGLLFGTCELIGNACLFVLCIFFSPDLIGPGTFANMILVGYISDFFRWLWARSIPAAVFTVYPARALVFALTLFFFIIGCAFYMNASMGLAPYDSIPFIINRPIRKVPFPVIRIGYDFFAILIGVLLGGHPTIGNFLVAVFLGPVIGIIGRLLSKKLGISNK